MGRRARLDRGILGVIGVRVANARQAASLQSGPASESVTITTAASVTVTADADEIPVGLDGEAIVVLNSSRLYDSPGSATSSGAAPSPRTKPGAATGQGAPARTGHDRVSSPRADLAADRGDPYEDA